MVRGACLVVLAGAFVVGCDSCFYYPSKRIYTSPTEMHLSYEDVWFSSPDGVRLHGWFLHARGHDRRRAGDGGGPAERAPTVVHFHGNAENISNHLPLAAWLPAHGYNVLLFDYRGYGRSEGRVTRKGTVLDGLAAVDYAASRPDVDRERLFAFGQSLGGAVATVVAAERPIVRALVLDGTFSSYRRIASRHLQKLLLARWLSDGLAAALVSRGYDPIDHIGALAPRPVMVITSREDAICFEELGQELYDAAGEPRERIALPRGAHLEGVFDDVDEVQGRIVAFFARAGSARREAD